MRSEDVLSLIDTPVDSPRHGKLPLPGLSSEDIESLKLQGNPVAALAGETTDKSYITLHRHKNVSSNSILQSLHACPRRFVLEKLQANDKEASGVERPLNVDFVFGHSVGAGVAAYLAFDKNLSYALYATFLSWYGNFDLGKEDYNHRKKKTIERAILAVEIFAHWWDTNHDEWEIFRLPDGRPAVELSFCVDLGKTKYFGHIDLVLRNKRTGRIAIGENKTTGFTNPHPAVYQNSGQAVGYALVLDKIVGDLAEYDVLYYAYSAPGEEWHHFPFHKTTAAKLEWVQDRLIDAGHIEQYFQLEHFPKNGGSCFQFNRACQFFGECDLVDKHRMLELPVLDDVSANYPVDYYFDVQELINRQVENVG
jgi:hypothetical protein